ncbi:hypothetical protein E4634_01525 [Mangrovimicrobium sediminis]|uniref:4Fe-4S Mo/W bis-MGD-type domain-containing protein n=1 Tax=Mangrovimicrobium sediminis TaxID=2562682 RepID=A0A4Z0M9P2_9GAMM|nr:molybdopterin-dependent oxidoreductase [Haliea sp. SAOS-164]TGD76251.1 hypothetical protein E4634_01525 [Haliea sp. SAOS-164]
MTHTAKTFCRNCGALCALEVTVDDDRITGVVADGSTSPYGGYMCPKGLASIDFHNGAEQRLTQHYKRGEDGSFAPIATRQALDEIGAKLRDLLAQYGPRSIAVYHGTGAYRSVLGGLLERALVAAIDSPNFFSTMTIDQSAKWVTMGRLGVMASGKPSFRDVDLGVLVGNNPVVSHQTFPFGPGESGAPGRAFAAARARGAKLIVIDPRRNETARFADLVIQPKPGHDAAIFAAIAHILLRDGTYNHDFCDRFASQLDALREAVAPFTPELAARRADITVEEIELAAQWIGAAKRPFVGSGAGPSMSAHSNLNDHMIEVVNALVGGYKRAGDRLYNPGTLNPKPCVEMAVSPTRSWESGVKCRTADVGKIFGEFPTALLPREITEPGEERIRALISFGGNPVMGLGDPARAVPAFEELELLVSLDARMNETCELSHYVMATSQPYERHDLSIPGDALYPEAFAQYAAPVVPAPGDVIHDWEFFWAVAARMSVPLTLKYWNYGLDYAAIKEGMELGTDPDSPPDPEAMIRFLCQKSRVPFEALRDNPGGVRPEIEPQFVQSAPEGASGRLELCPPDIVAELAALLAEEPDSRFAYQLTCRRLLETMNSAYRDADRTRDKYPENWASMNPEDMAAEGIVEGERVTIASEDGSISGVVRAESGVRRGVVSMSHMFGGLVREAGSIERRGSFTGELTSLETWLEPINFMPRFSGIPVNIAKQESAT